MHFTRLSIIKVVRTLILAFAYDFRIKDFANLIVSGPPRGFVLLVVSPRHYFRDKLLRRKIGNRITMITLKSEDEEKLL